MRRAAMAFLIVGFTFGEMVPGPGGQPVAEAASLTVAANSVKAAPVNAAKPARKTVTFAGYSVSVPVSWPVYDLTKDPRRCVRYDVHAVYLGSPGPDQDQEGGQGGWYLTQHRRGHGGRPGGARVGGGSPSRAGRIRFAITGAGS
jgi:hypothetical protein